MKISPMQSFIWLCAFAVLHPFNRANAQPCAVPCEAIDALDSFEIDVDADGLCTPVMATLFSDAPIPSCGDFSYHWEILGGDFEWNAGSLASDQAPSISFLDPVTYQIELTIAAAGFDECAAVSSTTYANAAGTPSVNASDGGEICAYDVWESLVYVNPGNTSLSDFAWIINGDSTFSSFPAPLNLPFEEEGEKEIIAWAQNSCGTSSDTSFVQVRALPQVTVESDYNWICQGASVQMNASGAETYTWSSSATPLSGGMIGDSIAVYEMQNSIIGGVEGTNVYETLSCSASGGFQVYSYFVPGISITGDDVICEGAPVELEAAVQSWGNVTSTQWVFNDTSAEGGTLNLTDLSLVPGDYAVSASVALDPFPTWLQPAGCSGTAQFDFTIAGLPQVLAPDGIAVCNQDFMEQLPEGSPVGGTWEGPFVSEGFFNPGDLTPGVTELEYHYTDSNGCAAFDAAVVQINEPIWAQAGSDSSVCETNDWLNLSGFEEVESGVWSGPALIDPYSGVVDVGELEVGQSVFIYEVGTASCATADTIVWTVLEHPVALLSTQESVACDQDTVWFEVFAAGGTLAAGNEYTYGWSNGVQFTASNEPYLIAEVNEGFSFVLVEITDDEGCTDAGSAFIEPIELPEITLPEAWQFCDQNVEVDAPMADPSMGVWSGQGVVDALGTFNPGLVGEGSHSLTYTVTNSSGCANADSILVDVTPLDSIAAGPDRSICLGTPILTLDNFYPNLGGWWSGTGVVDSISPVIQTSDFSEGMHAVVFHAGEGSCAQQDTVWIEIRPLPSATVDYLTTNNCPGDTLALLAQPWGGTTSDDYELSWSGSGVFAQGDEFFVNAPLSGPDTLAVSLQVTDASGCSGDVDATYIIRANPVVSTAESFETCDQEIAASFPEATPAGGTWELPEAAQVFSNGTFFPSELGVGTWPLIYRFVDDFGCSASDTTTLDVVTPQVLNLTSELEACDGTAFLELPVSIGSTGFWSGPALIDSIAGSVNSTELNTGEFGYIYSSGEASCLVTDTVSLIIHALPEVTGSVPGNGCTGDSVHAAVQVNAAFPIAALDWSSPGASILLPNDSVADLIWDAPGIFEVDLVATDANGCAGQASWSVVINALPDVFAGEDLWLCDQSFEEVLPSGMPVTDAFGSGSFFGLGLASGLVDLSGALDPANLGLGLFEVEYFYLDSATGCTNADTMQLTVQPLPTIFAGIDTAFCAGNEWVELESQSHDFETTWSGVGPLEQEALIDAFTGAVDLALLEPGMYAFELSGGQNSCLVSDQRILEVLNLPVIAMAAESTFCLGDTDQTLPLAMPTGGIWTGAGILDAEAGEFDTQIGAGDWVVAYEVEDALTGCLNSENHTVHMRSVPESAFPFIDEQCIGQALMATSMSTDVESYAWWLADSLISTTSDVSVLLEDAGVLELSLTVVNEWGCADTAQQDVEWLAPPIAAFTLSENEGCVPLDIGIYNAAEGMVDALQWSLDGMELLLESGDSLVFEQPSGSQGFTLEMEVSNQCGSNTAQAMIEVNAIPVVQLFDTPGPVCSPFLAEFNYTIEGQVETLTWDFGNGEEGSGFTPVWPTFEVTDESGLFSVALTAANGCGAFTDSAVVLVESSLVQAEFDLDLAVGCLPLDVQATDLSVGGDAMLLDFGDGATAFDSVAMHTFTEPGNFEVILAVSNACAVDSFALDVTVHPAFALELSSSNASACVGDSMLFDLETSGLLSTAQIEWISDAGNEAAPAPAIIPWTMPGDQVIFAQGADANGCMGYDTLTVAVHAPLAINAVPSVTSGCSPLDIAMDNQTIGAGEWSWTVDNGPQQSDAFAPNFSLLHSGTEATDLLIEVAVLNEWGCASAESFSIEVWPAPSAAFQLTDTVICGVPAVIDPFVDAVDGLQLAWFIDSALVAATGDAVLEIATLGDHAITLLSENEFGCQSFALDSVEVLELPELTLSAGPLMGCAPHLLEIDYSTEGAVEWLLEIHRDSTQVFMSEEMTFEVNLEWPGTYNLQLSAVSDRGCTSVLPLGDSVVVLPRPVVGFYADPYAGTFDSPDPLNSSWAFENTSDDGQAIWDFGDGELSSEWSTNHTYDAAGTYEVVLMVMNEHGCAEEFTMLVEVLENLEVYVPNAFTPPMQGYSDGINDGWKPVLSKPSLVGRYDLVVYNRYGQKVWETQDPEMHWVGEARVDGAYFAPGGIYTWVLQIDSRAFPESSRQWKGQVNLLR